MHLTAHQRSFAGIFKVVLLAALLSSAGAASAFAQDSNVSASTPPAAASQPIAPAAGTAKAEEAPKSEADEMDVYRHAPIVQSMARIMHMGLEPTARLFEFINFGILALAIGIPLFRFMPRHLRNRRQALQENLQSARTMTDEARARLAAVEDRLSRLDAEIAQIRAQVEEEGKSDEARIKASIGEESGRIVAAAEQEIATAAAQAKRELHNFAADLAIERAAHQLILTPESDRALIDDFVRDAVRRGQN